MDSLYFYLAISPIVLLLALIFIARRPLYIGAPMVWLYTLLLLWLIWWQSPAYLIAVNFKAFLLALDILLIIFGAIYFLEVTRKTHVLASLSHHLRELSRDTRIQVIILAWLFGSFLEGLAGFGTPAAIVAPLLVGLGVPVVTAVAVALVANSTAVAFGAVGTPVRVGLEGYAGAEIATNAAYLSMFIGVLVPVMLVAILIASSKKGSWKAFWQIVPFAIFAGMAFSVPYYFASLFGYDFPSIIGALVGLVVVFGALKLRLFVPKQVWQMGHSAEVILPLPTLKMLTPYLSVIVLLIFGKYIFQSYPLELISGIRHNINLFNPGLAFVIAATLYVVFTSNHNNNIRHAAVISVQTLVKPIVAIFFTIAFIQLMLNSGFNQSNAQAMILYIADRASILPLEISAPFIGAFGSFLSGSATVSNLIFGNFQAVSAEAAQLPVNKILAMQLVGAGAGNMIALSNIVAAQAAVETVGEEARIIRKTIVPCLIYTALAALLAYFLL